jgi:hypothetical protein
MGGNLFTGPKIFNLSYSDNGTGPVNLNGVTTDWDDFEGWNMIGNPYTSALDWDHPGIDKNSVGNVIYYYDDQNDLYKYYGGGTPYNQGISVNGGSRYIPSNQGFFVKATTNGTLTFPQEATVHDDQSFWKANEQEANLIRIVTEADNYTDETVIRGLKYASAEFDSDLDAYKLFPINPDRPNIYSLSEDGSIFYALNSIPNAAGNTCIPLGIYSIADQNHKIKITENTFSYSHVFLEDKQLRTKQNLLTNDIYEFEQSEKNETGRFYLHIQSNRPPRLNKKLQDQTVITGRSFSVEIPEDLFIDDDFEDRLFYTIQLSDGSILPHYLAYDKNCSCLTGQTDTEKTLNIEVRAQDIFGAFNTMSFKLTALDRHTNLTDMIEIFPNPASELLNVRLPLNVTITIFDTGGRIIKEMNLREGNHSINLNTLDPGIYIIKCVSGNRSFYKKLIKN